MPSEPMNKTAEVNFSMPFVRMWKASSGAMRFSGIASTTRLDKQRQRMTIPALDMMCKAKNVPLLSWAEGSHGAVPSTAVGKAERFWREGEVLYVEGSLYDWVPEARTIYDQLSDALAAGCPVEYGLSVGGGLTYHWEGAEQVVTQAEMTNLVVAPRQHVINSDCMMAMAKALGLEEAGMNANMEKALLPLAPEGQSWSGAAAEDGLRQWASSDGSGAKEKIDWGKYAQGFFYHVAGSENFSDYKFPFALVIDGKPEAVWNAIHTGLGRLAGSTLSADEQATVKGQMKAYYAAFDKPWPEDTNMKKTEETVETLAVQVVQESSAAAVPASIAASMGKADGSISFMDNYVAPDLEERAEDLVWDVVWPTLEVLATTVRAILTSGGDVRQLIPQAAQDWAGAVLAGIAEEDAETPAEEAAEEAAEALETIADALGADAYEQSAPMACAGARHSAADTGMIHDVMTKAAELCGCAQCNDYLAAMGKACAGGGDKNMAKAEEVPPVSTKNTEVTVETAEVAPDAAVEETAAVAAEEAPAEVVDPMGKTEASDVDAAMEKALAPIRDELADMKGKLEKAEARVVELEGQPTAGGPVSTAAADTDDPMAKAEPVDMVKDLLEAGDREGAKRAMAVRAFGGSV